MIYKRHLPLAHPFRPVAYLLTTIRVQPLEDRNFGQADILHHGPDHGETTGFGRESVNLIRVLSYIAKETLNGIGATDVAVHDWWKRIKRQEMLFIFA